MHSKICVPRFVKIIYILERREYLTRDNSLVLAKEKAHKAQIRETRVELSINLTDFTVRT
jgi:hypothetical protein